MDKRRPNVYPTIHSKEARNHVDEFYKRPQAGDADLNQYRSYWPEFRPFIDVVANVERRLSRLSDLDGPVISTVD
jgi:hypothetical protein